MTFYPRWTPQQTPYQASSRAYADFTDHMTQWTVYHATQVQPMLNALQHLENEGLTIMARRKNNSFTKTEFFTFRLDKTQKASFLKWQEAKAGEMVSMLDTLLSERYKISITADAEATCIIASLTCRDEDNPNENYCFSSRSDEWSEAIMLMCYKHFDLAAGGSWPVDTQDDSWG
jgi:hypothetical protein